jgi:hypothetical protein
MRCKRHAEVETEAAEHGSGWLTTTPATGRTALDAYSIPVFCARHGISERFYFKLKAGGRGPTEMRLGNRVLISREAAVRWRAEREAE